MDIIVGTAGHIDHGKTALVKALTGTDADRLPEEKERGITIDLGFAELSLDNLRIGFVDVPGHEKFVKNMLAGASGIDLVLLVVAADEGVMPQTREHFEICRLLGTKRGLIAVTKNDLVDSEFLQLVESDIAGLVKGTFLQTAPVIPVSSKTGEGIEELKATLIRLGPEIPPRADTFVTRMPIDRVFTVKGFGAVVTGTIATGQIEVGTDMELVPDGKVVRIRGLQNHGSAVSKAHAGQRAAVNLGGVDYTEIKRGMVLSETEILRPTQIVDAEMEVLASAKRAVKSRHRVRMHLGTVEALARVQVLNPSNEIKPGQSDLVQIRLERPIIAVPGERFILRQYSPQLTIAGGQILDSAARKHRKKEASPVNGYLEKLKNAVISRSYAEYIALVLGFLNDSGLNYKDLRARTGWQAETLQKALEENIKAGLTVKCDTDFIAHSAFKLLKEKLVRFIGQYHRNEPLSPGIMRETLREKTASHLSVNIFRAALTSLESDGEIWSERDIVRLSSYHQQLSGEEEKVSERLIQTYLESGRKVPTLENALQHSINGTGLNSGQARKLFQLLLNSGEIIKVSEEFYFSRQTITELVSNLREFANALEDRQISVAEFKDLTGVSRKYAIPLLEYLDIQKITRREGDKRLVL